MDSKRLLLSALLLMLACDKGRRSAKPSDGPTTDSGASASNVAPEPTVAERDGQSGHIDRHVALPWSGECRIHRPCSPLPVLPRCAPGLGAFESSKLTSLPPNAVGELLAVRGPITLTSAWMTEVGCRRPPGVHGCCNDTGAEAIIGRLPHAILLDNLGCAGDESRLCCDVPVFGQTVVAVGKLARDRTFERDGVHWALKNATLCDEGPAVARRALSCEASPGR